MVLQSFARVCESGMDVDGDSRTQTPEASSSENRETHPPALDAQKIQFTNPPRADSPPYTIDRGAWEARCSWLTDMGDGRYDRGGP